MYNIICKLKQVVFERSMTMLIDGPRSKIKKIVIALIVMDVVAAIAIACSIILFYVQMVPYWDNCICS